MNTLLADPIVSTVVSLAVKATVVLAAAGLVNAVLRARGSAATRHLVWTLTAVALLLLPALTLIVPAWPAITRVVAPPADRPTVMARADAPIDRPLAVLDSPIAAAAGTVSLPKPSLSSNATRRFVATTLATGYLAGLVLVLAFLVLQWRAARRLTRDAAPVDDPEWVALLRASADALHVGRPVRLLRSRDRSMPVALGIWRSVIVVPSIADTWTLDRRRAVLLHELAHVARRDCLTQLLAWTMCAVYWFHPAAWWVARRLQVERELACDDLVVGSGAGAREYAGHLLEIAYDFSGHRTPALAVGMARRRQLEHRLLAIVDTARNRTVPAWKLRAGSAVAAVALIAPLAGATASEVAVQDGKPPVTTEKTLSELRLVDAVFTALRTVFSAFGVAQDRLPGTWEIRQGDREGVVHFRMTEVNSSYGNDVPIDRFDGLTSAQLAGTGPLQFRLRRDAGTFTFEGVARNGAAAGTFSFTPNPAFGVEMKKRGLAAPTVLEQYQLARHDIGYAFVDELTRQGYPRPQPADLVRTGEHGVSTTYLSEMGALGYRLESLNPLITLRDHGVTPGYVRALAAFGYKGLSGDDVRNARDHGISPDWVQGMRDAGYRDLSLAKLIEARDHGVSGEFAQQIQGSGQGRMPIDDLIRVRDHGVTPEYARSVRALGYDAVTLDELVTLRDHGLTPERIRSLNQRAGTRLPVDMLKSLADGGAK